MRDAEGYKLPMSEQEERLDRDVAVVVADQGQANGKTSNEKQRTWGKGKSKSVDSAIEKEKDASEAGKIAEEWMRKNMGDAYQPRPRSPSPPPAAGTCILDTVS